jgi:GTP:adenosylcobinamide-phosphate guanylyltransferase
VVRVGREKEGVHSLRARIGSSGSDTTAAFDHVDTPFTVLSCHVYNILDVLVVHCLHSGSNCLALSAWVSACSFRGSPQCALTAQTAKI